MIGIYKITNIINNNVYVGQSVDINRRWRQHRKSFESLLGNRKLIQEVKQYGRENFIFEVIEECPMEQLDILEKYYISIFDSYFNGLNMTTGGQFGNHGNSIKISNEELIEIYDLLINSKVSQKQIATDFNIGQDTVSEINNGKTRRLDGYNFPLRKNNNRIEILVDQQIVVVNERNICPLCGSKKASAAQMCHVCRGLKNRISDRPDMVSLAREIVEFGFLAVGRKYGVSDNAIRKWCRTYGLPLKKNEIKDWLDSQK